MKWFVPINVFILGLTSSFCLAQSADAWKVRAWEEVEQHLTPAAITADALNHKLFDDSRLGSHNAASFYYRACLKWAALPKSHRIKLNERRDEWFGNSISDLPTVEVEQWLADSESVFTELDKGLSGVCDWGLSDEKLTFSQQIALDFSVEQAVLNEFGDILRLKARLHAARSEFDEAIESIADCIKLAKDAGKLPASFYGSTMTNGIAYPAVQLLNELAMMPGCPNLFHALQTLPRPVADYLSDIKQQHKIIQRSFPFLDDPENSKRTDAQWQSVFLDAMTQLGRANRWNIERRYPNSWRDHVAANPQKLSILFAKLYPVAKRQLIEAGWNRDELNAMPVGQVIAIQTNRLWNQYTDLLNGIENLPASRVRQRAMQLENSDLIYGDVHGCFPLNLIVLTQENLLRPHWQLVEVSMNLQLLRNHLAKTGAFPTEEQFENMNPLPDPKTGLPFQYRKLENGDAQLQSKPTFYEGSSGRDDYVRVRYIIKKVVK